MNRHARRAAEAQSRTSAPGQDPGFSPEEVIAGEELLAGCRWEQIVDPTDERFSIVTMRVPGMSKEPIKVEHREALEAMVKFSKSVLSL